MSSLQYGVNLPASNVKAYLEKNDIQQDGVRSWQKLFGNASLGFNAQSDNLKSYYSDAMNKAYANNFEQKNNIIGSGLSNGSTQRYLGINAQELNDTYEKYINNYGKDAADLSADYGTEVSAIDADLNKRAENFSSLFNSAYDYLSSELSNTDYLQERGLNWLVDEKTNELKDWNSLELFDDNQQLTDKGTTFFKEIYNAQPQTFVKDDGTNAKSFDEWLSNTNSELRDWWVSSDDFNSTFAGTNKGTANVILGRESTDDKTDTQNTILGSGSYDNALTSIKEETSKVLTNEGDTPIRTISDLGNYIKETKAGTNKKKTYDQWFEWGQKFENRKLYVTGLEYDRVYDFSTSYIKDFKKYATTEFTTLKSTISKEFGENFASEFLNTYGQEVDKLYKEIQTYKPNIDSKLNKAYGDAVHDPATTKRALKDATTLRDMGFQDAMTRLYKNLEVFVNKKQAIKTNTTSGF